MFIKLTQKWLTSFSDQGFHTHRTGGGALYPDVWWPPVAYPPAYYPPVAYPPIGPDVRMDPWGTWGPWGGTDRTQRDDDTININNNNN